MILLSFSVSHIGELSLKVLTPNRVPIPSCYRRDTFHIGLYFLFIYCIYLFTESVRSFTTTASSLSLAPGDDFNESERSSVAQSELTSQLNKVLKVSRNAIDFFFFLRNDDVSKGAFTLNIFDPFSLNRFHISVFYISPADTNNVLV